MKFISFIVISLSLCLGLVAALLSYVPSLDLADDELIGLTLNAPAGRVVVDETDQDVLDGLRSRAIERLTQAHIEANTVEEENADEDDDGEAAAEDAADPSTVEEPEPAPTTPSALRAMWVSARLDAAFAGIALNDEQIAMEDASAAATACVDAAVAIDEETGVIQISGAALPFAVPGTELTTDALVIIRANLEREGVSMSDDPSDYRVRVKEFALSRWEGKWFFLASCVGLVVGAGIVRASAASALAAGSAHHDPSESPLQALSRAHDEVVELRAKLSTMGHSPEALSLITHELDRISQAHFDPFVEARPALIGALGMGGYARLMDAFAGAERQLNRAWSAAADNVPEESFDCLARGVSRLEDAVKLLPKQK